MTQGTGQPHASADGQWRWDGAEWRPNIPPPDFPGPSAPAPAVVDNSFAWALAFAPLLSVMATAALTAAGWPAGAALAVIVAIGINIGLSVADVRRIRAAGQDIPVALAAFLVPVYLFMRQSRLHQNYAIPIVWCAAFLVSLGGGSAFGGGGVAIDTGLVQQQIQSSLQDRTGTTVQVVCPTSVDVNIGQTFQCTALAPDGSSAVVTVTVENSSGYVVWRVSP